MQGQCNGECKMTPQLEKIQEHLRLFHSLRYISADLHATETLSFDNYNDTSDKKDSNIACKTSSVFWWIDKVINEKDIGQVFCVFD